MNALEQAAKLMTDYEAHLTLCPDAFTYERWLAQAQVLAAVAQAEMLERIANALDALRANTDRAMLAGEDLYGE